jgi:hypothetical protein
LLPSGASDLTIDFGFTTTCTPVQSSIASNFNGTAIPAGDTIWFSSVISVKGLGSGSTTVHFVNASLSFTAGSHTYNIPAPNATVVFSPSVSTATTTYDAAVSTWITTVPLTGLSGNVFLTGVQFPIPAGGLPGGIKNVTWQGGFSADTKGLTVNWQWAAAAYTSFSTSYNQLGVKPVDDTKASQYKNSDHAGTPESYTAFVTGGATGGGGSNFTGSYSSTASVMPNGCCPAMPASLSGFVYNDVNDDGVYDSGDVPITGVVITLTGTSTGGAAITISHTTDASGYYSFTGLQPGTYKLTESQPTGYLEDTNNVGTVNGVTDGSLTSTVDVMSTITLASCNDGINYNFGELKQGSSLVKNMAATIGFWHNNNGQALLYSLNGGGTTGSATALGNWLAESFPNLYGATAGSNNLSGKTNAQVAAFFNSIFAQTGQPGQAAQVLAAAFAVYVTSSNLAGGTYAAGYGFIMNQDGTGIATINVGSNGAAFGVANNTTLSVIQLLHATNNLSSGGVLYNGNSDLTNAAELFYEKINENSDIH